MMMELMYRPALPEDAPAIIDLRKAYLRGLFRGFASSEQTECIANTLQEEALCQWMEEDAFQVDVAHKGDALRGFIAFGNSGEEGLGLIRDFGCRNDCDSRERWAIVEHSLHQLTAKGYRDACMWVLVDNFRVRFLFESMGFRPDGNRRTDTLGGEPLYMARYTMHLNQ